jgi:hypothetical protein
VRPAPIAPGDTVTLGAANGLGLGRFVVQRVYAGDPIHKLLVRGPNGETWPARLDGAVRVEEAPPCSSSS